MFGPHALTPTQFGILSAARLTEIYDKEDIKVGSEERWVRGYDHYYETQPTLRILTESAVVGQTLYDGTGVARYIRVKPFFIEVEDYASTFGVTSEDRFAKVLRQIEVASQKAVEREFLKGYAARADQNDNQYLAKALTLNILRPYDQVSKIHEGLGYLEAALADSPTGEQGVIHMTRDMAALLGSQFLLMRVEDDPGRFHLETTNGTTVVVGSGYDGSGPIVTLVTKEISGNGLVATLTSSTPHGLYTDDTTTVAGVGTPFDGDHIVTATSDLYTFSFTVSSSVLSARATTGTAFFAPDQNHKWLYATGTVDVNLGKSEVVNDNLAQAYDVHTNQNNLRIKAIRPAAVHHDPSMHFGIKVQVHE